MHRVSVLVVPLALLACDKQATGPLALGGGEVPPERVVAIVGDDTVTVDDLQEQVNRETAFVRSRYSAPEKLKTYLDNVVRFEVMFQEAQRRGYDNDPDIVRIYKQQMVARLLQKDFEPQFKPSDVPEDVVRAYWTSHRSKFDEPEMVRAQHILVTNEKALEAVKNDIDTLRAMPSGKEARWRELVNAHSQDMGSKPVAGDLGWLTRDKNVKEIEVLQTAFSMSTPGEISEPVKTVAGWHFVRFVDRKAPVEKPFEAVENVVRVTVYKEHRQNALEKWVGGLRAKTHIEKFEDNLDKVEVDLSDVEPPATTQPSPRGASRVTSVSKSWRI